MAYSNYPSATPQAEPPKQRDNRAIIYGLLTLLLLGSWGYIIWDKTKAKETIAAKDLQITNLDSAKNSLQSEYNAALTRLDDMTGKNAKLDSLLKRDEAQIAEKNRRIKQLLTKQNATEAELREARQLIGELNGRIDGYVMEIEKLKGENLQLTQDKQQLTTEKEQLTSEKTALTETKTKLEEKVDIASTLNASNINIVAINEKRGGREKQTDVAKRVDKLKVSFDVFNRIAEPGEKDVYVVITDPEGKVVSNEALGSGKFTTREEGEKLFTQKNTVVFATAQKVTVDVSWKPNSNFARGEYKIEIYNNGFKIGEAKKGLKKGGLFS
jgi:FtsZ-binding cell division protein ZapB